MRNVITDLGFYVCPRCAGKHVFRLNHLLCCIACGWYFVSKVKSDIKTSWR